MLDPKVRQRIEDRVDDRLRRGDAAGLACAFDTERVHRCRQLGQSDVERWQIVGARQSVIHKGAAQQLARSLVVDRVFEQRLSDALREPALHLTNGQHRVDQPAVIIDRGVTFERGRPGFGIDLDFRGVTALVSAWTKRKALIGSPKRSAAICGKLVSWPWPFDCVPSTRTTRPSPSKRISARSPGVPRDVSRKHAMPSPRSLPRSADSWRRAAKPSLDTRRAISSRLAANLPQSIVTPSPLLYGNSLIRLRRRNATGSRASRRAA